MLIKLLVLLILWYTGLLSQLLIIAGGLLIWAGAVLQPGAF
jgi:hypothetical protein